MLLNIIFTLPIKDGFDRKKYKYMKRSIRPQHKQLDGLFTTHRQANIKRVKQKYFNDLLGCMVPQFVPYNRSTIFVKDDNTYFKK